VAYENESFEDQCARIGKKLAAMCERRVEGKPCAAHEPVDFEDCCTPCQGARTLYYVQQNWPGLVSRAREVDSLRMFQINALGGWG
jgi:hypothetical protein